MICEFLLPSLRAPAGAQAIRDADDDHFGDTNEMVSRHHGQRGFL
jgi:hypothetical protein